MDALAWNFFISSMLSLLTKHSCQVPADHRARTLNPVVLLQPAASGISYEALQYPVPMDQYQLIPLVINTGRIPLINHAVQAPIQYFVAGGDNQRVASDDQARRSTPTQHQHQHQHQQQQQQHEHEQQPRGPESVVSDAARTEENSSGRKRYPPTTMYSETRVGGRSAAASSRYSHGYKVIDGRHESRDGGGRAEAGERVARTGDGSGERDDGPGASGAPSKPIVVKPNPKTTRAELKKRYKTVRNATRSETPIIDVTDGNGISTASRPQ